MRRASAGFFLAVILLHLAGYYLLMEGWKWHASLGWQEEQRAEELIIRIPLNLPYQVQSGEWQSADQQVKYQGKSYRIIRQRMDVDALYLACQLDKSAERIDQQLEELVQSFAGTDGDARQSTSIDAGFMKEYLAHHTELRSAYAGWSRDVDHSSFISSFQDTYHPSILLPPEGC